VGVHYGGAVAAQLEAVRAGTPAPRDGEVSRRPVRAATAAV